MLYFSIENARGEREKSPLLRGGLRRTVSCSDVARIILGSAPHWKWRFSCFREIYLKCWRVNLRGRRSIRWCSRMTPVVPRIGNNVSHVTRISYDSHFARQAQYSVMLEDDTGCSAHCKWHFICDEDQSWQQPQSTHLSGSPGGWQTDPCSDLRTGGWKAVVPWPSITRAHIDSSRSTYATPTQTQTSQDGSTRDSIQGSHQRTWQGQKWFCQRQGQGQAQSTSSGWMGDGDHTEWSQATTLHEIPDWWLLIGRFLQIPARMRLSQRWQSLWWIPLSQGSPRYTPLTIKGYDSFTIIAGL